nr:hypothetical protein [uncultured Dysosmobacter sp.]
MSGEQREPAASAAYKRFAKQNLGEGGFTSPEQNEIRGPVKRSFMGIKRNKNAEISQRALAILEEKKADISA